MRNAPTVVFTVLLPLVLDGCLGFAAAMSIPTQVVSGNENGVTVKMGSIRRREPGALNLASAHCQQYGKSVRELSRIDTGTATTVTYSCIRP